MKKPSTIEIVLNDSALSAIHGDSHLNRLYYENLEALSRAGFPLASSQRKEVDPKFRQLLFENAENSPTQVIFSGAFIMRPVDLVDLVEKSIKDSTAYTSHDINDEKLIPIRNRRFSLELPLIEQPSVMVLPRRQQSLSTGPLRLSPKHNSYKTAIRKNGSESRSRSVSTLVRFHEGADKEKLKRALYSLAAQKDCTVEIVLCTQNLSAKSRLDVETILRALPLRPNESWVLLEFHSQNYGNRKDLRSEMLHYGLKRALESSPDFFAILDYDDFLFNFAYSELLDQQLKYGHPISLARVYGATYEESGLVVTQTNSGYFKGKNYREFLKWNFIPTHSVLLPKSELRGLDIAFIPGMKFLEDYYLLLQVVGPANSNWQALSAKHQKFIGIYSLHSQGTLSATDISMKLGVLQSREYRLAIHEIEKLKRSLRSYSGPRRLIKKLSYLCYPKNEFR